MSVTTNAEFIKYMQTLPADAEVRVMVNVEGKAYQGDTHHFEPVSLVPQNPEWVGDDAKSTEHIDVSECLGETTIYIGGEK